MTINKGKIKEFCKEHAGEIIIVGAAVLNMGIVTGTYVRNHREAFGNNDHELKGIDVISDGCTLEDMGTLGNFLAETKGYSLDTVVDRVNVYLDTEA